MRLNPCGVCSHVRWEEYEELVHDELGGRYCGCTWAELQCYCVSPAEFSATDLTRLGGLENGLQNFNQPKEQSWHHTCYKDLLTESEVRACLFIKPSRRASILPHTRHAQNGLVVD